MGRNLRILAIAVLAIAIAASSIMVGLGWGEAIIAPDPGTTHRTAAGSEAASAPTGIRQWLRSAAESVGSLWTPRRNVISIGKVSAVRGTSGAFKIFSANKNAISAAEVWFTYDSAIGLSVVSVTTTWRTEGWAVAYSKNTDDPTAIEVHILLYNLDRQTIDPGRGAILLVEYDVTAEASGESPLDVTQVNLAHAEGEALPALWRDGVLQIEEEKD